MSILLPGLILEQIGKTYPISEQIFLLPIESDSKLQGDKRVKLVKLKLQSSYALTSFLLEGSKKNWYLNKCEMNENVFKAEYGFSQIDMTAQEVFKLVI